MHDHALQPEIHKRLTLNWLIQGAAQHAGMTFQHLIRDDLDALEPDLLRLYDQYALINLLQYWQPEAAIIFGWPTRFWKKAATQRSHPFFGHLLLSKYGGALAIAARERALKRCREKGLVNLPFAFTAQTVKVVGRLCGLEAMHRPRLVQLSKAATTTVWGIPSERLEAALVDKVVPPSNLWARSFRDAMFLAGLVGYGAVSQRGDQLLVVARATNWQLLTKELVKGTAELICLHGLNQLSDEAYQRVVDVTDRIEFEPWMLQSGGELWRRLLASLPPEAVVAQELMRLARLPADELESQIAAVIERPE